MIKRMIIMINNQYDGCDHGDDNDDNYCDDNDREKDDDSSIIECFFQPPSSIDSRIPVFATAACRKHRRCFAEG